MHPILFRIPLPPAAQALVGARGRRRDRPRLRRASPPGGAIASGVISSLVVVAACAGAGWKWHDASYQAPNVPIYAYGVMLGVSLVVGWYLTLPLADKDGLPKETMANCYVVTALAALAGARLLYVVTNPDEFKSVFDLFALRNGGLVAYGGFLGGLLGQLGVPRAQAHPPAGVGRRRRAQPRVGPDDHAHRLLPVRLRLRHAPARRRASLAQDARARSRTGPRARSRAARAAPRTCATSSMYRGTPLEQELAKMNSSFPVHPTQLYESLVGLALLVLLLWQRRYTRFRGQVFFLFVFGYGFLRFLLELWRDDVERGSYGPTLDQHVVHPVLPACSSRSRFTYGISLGITNARARMVARVLVVRAGHRGVPGAAAGELRAAGAPTSCRPARSSACSAPLAVAYFYASFWQDARKNPALAMSLGDAATIRELRGEEPVGAEPEKRRRGRSRGGGRRR